MTKLNAGNLKMLSDALRFKAALSKEPIKLQRAEGSILSFNYFAHEECLFAVKLNWN